MLGLVLGLRVRVRVRVRVRGSRREEHAVSADPDDGMGRHGAVQWISQQGTPPSHTRVWCPGGGFASYRVQERVRVMVMVKVGVVG